MVHDAMATLCSLPQLRQKAGLPNFQRAFEWDDFLPARKFSSAPSTRKRSKPATYVSGGVLEKNGEAKGEAKETHTLGQKPPSDRARDLKDEARRRKRMLAFEFRSRIIGNGLDREIDLPYFRRGCLPEIVGLRRLIPLGDRSLTVNPTCDERYAGLHEEKRERERERERERGRKRCWAASGGKRMR